MTNKLLPRGPIYRLEVQMGDVFVVELVIRTSTLEEPRAILDLAAFDDLDFQVIKGGEVAIQKTLSGVGGITLIPEEITPGGTVVAGGRARIEFTPEETESVPWTDKAVPPVFRFRQITDDEPQTLARGYWVPIRGV